MAGDVMKKVQPGDRLNIAAETFNTFIDAARDFRMRTQGFGRQPRPTFGSQDIITIRNESGSQVGRLGILGIAGVLWNAAVNEEGYVGQPLFQGVTPAVDSAQCHVGKFAVCLQPLAPQEIGRAAIGGRVAVKVEITHGCEYNWPFLYADIKPGDTTQLKLVPHGTAQLLHRDTPTGEYPLTAWAQVRLGPPQGDRTFMGVLQQDLPYEGTATVRLYSYQAGHWVQIGNYPTTTVDVQAMAPPLLPFGGVLRAGKFVAVTFYPVLSPGYAYQWMVTGAEC